MPIRIEMPRLSDTMQQGTVVKWNVKEGQKIKSGDVIADIETDKATMELPSYDDGVVASLAVAEGTTVPVGTLIVVLAGTGETVEQARAAAGGAGGAAAPAKAVAANGAGAAAAGGGSAVAVAERAVNGSHANSASAAPGGRIFASPLARKIAQEGGIDLAGVSGTGPSGRIIRRDVEAIIASGLVAPRTAPIAAPTAQPVARPAPVVVPASGARLEPRRVALSNMRRVIATRLVQSKQTVPHYQVTVEVDMEPLSALRQQLNDQLASQGVKLSVNDFIVRACALAMHQHPFVNSRWVEAKGQDPVIEIVGDVNIGVAIALDESKGGGLVVGTLRHADQVGLRQISAETKRLGEKARGKGLSPEEMSDATFTISNLGMFGVSHFTAIINPPNAAILAVGAAIDRPVVKDGKVVPGKVMAMTMSSDHRIVDGAMAAQYLATVKDLMEKPATLLV